MGGFLVVWINLPFPSSPSTSFGWLGRILDSKKKAGFNCNHWVQSTWISEASWFGQCSEPQTFSQTILNRKCIGNGEGFEQHNIAIHPTMWTMCSNLNGPPYELLFTHLTHTWAYIYIYIQGGAPPTYKWIIIPLTIDILTINHSYGTYKPT